MPGDAHGTFINIPDAGDQIVRHSLLNDWSASRDGEMGIAPARPFLTKSFMTSASPWIVKFEALMHQGW
ncbi:fumarylacetoacetate hydrolase family protein [Paraburkholderia sp.]|uniref:fumarylacetoacetate hydrolase family protein n=1 Tax=Paraburkholderia sp. TaxID=1926495 RepID=UPI000940B32D